MISNYREHWGGFSRREATSARYPCKAQIKLHTGRASQLKNQSFNISIVFVYRHANSTHCSFFKITAASWRHAKERQAASSVGQCICTCLDAGVIAERVGERADASGGELVAREAQRAQRVRVAPYDLREVRRRRVAQAVRAQVQRRHALEQVVPPEQRLQCLRAAITSWATCSSSLVRTCAGAIAHQRAEPVVGERELLDRAVRLGEHHHQVLHGARGDRVPARVHHLQVRLLRQHTHDREHILRSTYWLRYSTSNWVRGGQDACGRARSVRRTCGRSWRPRSEMAREPDASWCTKLVMGTVPSEAHACL